MIEIIVFLVCCDALEHKSEEEPQNKLNGIGAIIEYDSRAGRQEKLAMQMAIDDFCAHSSSNYSYCPTLLINDFQGDSIQAAFLTRTMIKEQNVRAVLIGLETWRNALLVAETGNGHQVPVLSFTNEVPIRTCEHLPFLVNAARSQQAQMKAVAAIIQSWQWQKVNVIYEDIDSAVTGIIPYLIEAIQTVGSQISSLLPLPLYSSNINILGKLESLKEKQCRVFIVHTSSIHLATKIFKEAKNLGMMEEGSVWITTTSITNQIDLLNSSSISSMQGVLGIKTYFSQSGKRFQDFHSRFMVKYRNQYPHELNLEPGILALQAYDAAWSVALALEGRNQSCKDHQNRTDYPSKQYNHMVSNVCGKELLDSILRSNFDGLYGSFKFNMNNKLPQARVFEIVNVVGRSYRELGYWSEGLGFSKSIIHNSRNNYNVSMRILGQVFWPGGPWTVPRGWALPNSSKPLRIGVPARTTFKDFVEVRYDTKGNPVVEGFSIDVFKSVVELLPYHLPYVFVPLHGPYDSMVQQIQLESIDGVVADTAIIANRCNYAEFSQPYAESGLQMLIYFKPKRLERAWLFTKPFTPVMWAFTVITNIYNGFVIWRIERDSHPELNQGPFSNKVGTMLSLAFTTLFSQQGGEKLTRNSSRMAFVVWLFVAMVITQSFTASLTTLLTVDQLTPTTVSVETLKKTGAKVGCDGNSFVVKYLEEVLRFRPENIVKMYSGDDYPQALQTGKIAAAFLEVPYAKLLLSKYCNNFTTSGQTFKIGGFGYAFPRSSPYLPDISQAILKVTENGRLLELEKKMLSSYNYCSSSRNDAEHNGSLGMNSFYGLFLITGGTSTAALLIFNFSRDQEEDGGGGGDDDDDDDNDDAQEIELSEVQSQALIEPGRDHQDDRAANNNNAEENHQ
ncbi:glutamate receptor 2.8-like [Humulus lupulus]|uniref:glutamate receptor 2.8-like n=1 Tax=Humulus lupulus TaxID=3486 RepID=UPI002B40E9A0|nr:glutamate receptor 2.8-like [Humulus lupulus]